MQDYYTGEEEEDEYEDEDDEIAQALEWASLRDDLAAMGRSSNSMGATGSALSSYHPNAQGGNINRNVQSKGLNAGNMSK